MDSLEHVTGLLMRAIGSDWPPLKLEPTVYSKPKLCCHLWSEQDARVIHNYNRAEEDHLPVSSTPEPALRDHAVAMLASCPQQHIIRAFSMWC